MIELVVFDWDGTLMDSEARIVHAMQSAFEACALTPPEAPAVRDIIGLDLGVAVTRLAPAAEAAILAEVVSHYRRQYRLAQRIPSPLFGDVVTTLRTLAAHGLLLAVATGKSRAGLDRAMREVGIAQYFAATRCGDETDPKPHPAMLTEILDELAVAPASAVMVGDTEYDLQMARAAGVPGVAVTYGAHARERLLSCGPAYVIDSIGALADLLVPPAASNRERLSPIGAMRLPTTDADR